MQCWLGLETGLNFGGSSCPVILGRIYFLGDLSTSQKFIFTCPDGCMNFVHVDVYHKIRLQHMLFDVGVSLKSQCKLQRLSVMVVIMGSLILR